MFKHTVKRYFKDPLYVISLMLFNLLIFFILKRYQIRIYHFRDYCISAMAISPLLFTFYAFLSYEFSSKLARVKGIEILQSVSGAEGKKIVAESLMFSILTFIPTLIAFGLAYSGYSAMPGFLTRYSQHIVVALLRYLYAPTFLASLLGLILAKVQRPLAFTLIAFSTLLMSDVPNALLSSYTIGTLSLASVLDWFQLAVPNRTYYFDGVYGYFLEPSRLWILLLWFSLFLFLLICIYAKKSTKRHITLILLAVTLFLSSARFALRGEDSILIKDNRPGSMISIREYYENLNLSEGDKEPKDLDIESYQMDFSLGRYLKAKVQIQLIKPLLADADYIFTLDHHYKVTQILDQKQQPVSFIQEADHIKITPTASIDALTFTYHGGGMSRFYSNSQGMALPGYLAYYPRPGLHKPIHIKKPSALSPDANVKNLFTVHVHAPYPVFSNLPQTATNTFSGKTEELTLLGGLVEQVKDGVGSVVYGPMTEQVPTVNRQEVQQLWNTYAGLFPEAKPLNIDRSTIFFMPSTFFLAPVLNEQYVYYDDSLLAIDAQPNPSAIVSYYIKQFIPPVKTDLEQIVIETLVYSAEGLDKKIERPKRESLQILIDYKPSQKSALELSKEDNQDFFFYSDSIHYLEELVLSLVYEYGPQQVLGSVINYLRQDDEKPHIVDFLWDLDSTYKELKNVAN